MLKILIENKELYIKIGTSIQMEMNNSIFNTEKIEGDVIFTFDVPAQKNDLVFSHARYIYVQRLKKYKAVVSVGGVEFANGDLYLQKSSKNSYSCGVVVNPYPEGFADRKLKENQYGEDLIISENYQEHKTKFIEFLKKTIEPGSNIRFPLFKNDSFYGASNEGFGIHNGQLAGLEGHNKLLNRLFFDRYGEVVESRERDSVVRVFNSMPTDPLDEEIGWNSFAFAPAMSFLWLINKIVENAGYKLTGDFKDDLNVKRMICQSLRGMDISASHFFLFNSGVYAAVNQQLDTWYTVNQTGKLELLKKNLFDKENTNMWDDTTHAITITKAGNYHFHVKIKALISKQAFGEGPYSDASRYCVFFSCNFLDQNGNIDFNNFISGYPYPEWVNPNCVYSEIYHTFGGSTALDLTDLNQDSNGHRIGEFEYVFQQTFDESDIGKKIGFFFGYQMIYYDSNNDLGSFNVYGSQSQSKLATYIYTQQPENSFFDLSRQEDIAFVSAAMSRSGKFNIFSNILKYSEHVPDLTNGELLNTVCSLFGLNYYIDSRKKQIELSFFKDTILGNKFLDLSKYVLTEETIIEEQDEKQYEYFLEPTESEEIDVIKKIDDVIKYSDIPYCEFNIGKYCLVKAENRYNLSKQDDVNWSISWIQGPGNDHKLVCGESEDVKEVKPALKVPGNDRYPGAVDNNFPDINLQGASALFDTENNDFPLILMNYFGLSDFGNGVKYVRSSPVCYNDNGNNIRGVDITATGENSVGEIYVKPWLNFLAKCEYVVYKLLVPLSVFLQIIALLKPQDSETKAQTRWALIDGVRLLPVTMTFEFTEGKENIKAEIKFAKEKITL